MDKKIIQDIKPIYITFQKPFYHYTKRAKKKMNKIMNYNNFHQNFMLKKFFFFWVFNNGPDCQVTDLEFKKFKCICEKSDSYFSLKYVF